ncbi:fungal-specific transcription factor domain-containing protein [Phaeosphaeriaceae sp. PMI808]|nr:fungal-specific transcription factor domain-containing protein [Phaeosphaeriaceae sp. PMI808]
MPRPKKPGVEPKRRSRNGCWPCKARKVKCGEEKPGCVNCERQNETCDYNIRLNWGGRTKRDKTSDWSSASESPFQTAFSIERDVSPLFPAREPSVCASHVRSRSNISPPRSNNFNVDPELLRMSQSKTPPITSSTKGSYDILQYTKELSHSQPYAQSQHQSTLEFSSLSTSSFEPLNYRFTEATFMNVDAPLFPSSMPPPRGSLDSSRKHHKQSYSMESPATTWSDARSPFTGPLDPYSPYMATPLTPNSSVGSDEHIWTTASKQQSPNSATPDLRRMSVQSIINNELSEHNYGSGDGQQYPITDFSNTTYGFDLGLPDLDTPNNDDLAAIAAYNPQGDSIKMDEESSYEGPYFHNIDMVFGSEGYYTKPIPIRIPKRLGTLPPILMENRMNLLYFHHFINHIARVLVPHDCERNPFRQILPEMAVGDENIMNLLLAYSAAHRARMLNHSEPSNRIAVWVQDVFPKLRQTLTEISNDISDNSLAVVIMMASLEIISTGTFEVPISWQNHLTMARQMIMARGGLRGMGRQHRVAYFLSRWFAYLDVLGSLSGNKKDIPLSSAYWSGQNEVADEDFEIDCLMGFTPRCFSSLARISELAKICEPHRIDEAGNVRDDWIPGPEIVQQAIQIRHQLEEGLLERNIRKGCNHHTHVATESEGAWDATEIYATNEMFHYAGLIHLYRRVLGKTASDIEVQNAVREIVGLLYKIRRGSTAEACLIFPMFAAGCNTEDQGRRDKIMERLRSVEGFGMTHTPQVATLLQSVWDTGKPWESLVSGEFFG